jgi:hypothetical protein
MPARLTLISFFASLTQIGLAGASDAPALADGACGVYTWASWNPNRVTRETHPLIKGVPIIMHWRDVEPTEGQFRFDTLLGEKLRVAARHNFYVHLMIWVAPSSPEWLYENGVPRVKVPPRINPFRKEVKPVFPYYLDENYKRHFFRLIRECGAYVKTLPPDLRDRIIFIQSAEGSTGDGQPYKGKPIDSKYAISREEWSAFRIETWKVYKEAFQEGVARPIPLLVNNDANRTAEHRWMLENLEVIGCKQGMFSHGYHISDTRDRLAKWRAFVGEAEKAGARVFTRGEQDGEWNICGWSRKNPPQAFYWAALFALHCGLDVWNVPHEAAAGDYLKDALDFFNKYAGRNDPASSPGAFCALRQGLDASDTSAFPEGDFGKAEKRNVQRYLDIVKNFASRGAYQGDPEKATGGGMMNRQRDDYNDVGWGILPGNYWRFLEQVEPDKSSVGLWHVKPDEHVYSRFARSFERESGRRAMSFRLDERFFAEAGRPQSIKVRVSYLDAGDGKWALVHVGPEGPKTAVEVQCRDSGQWKNKTVAIDDAYFNKALPNGADLAIEHRGGGDTVFHMIELDRP